MKSDGSLNVLWGDFSFWRSYRIGYTWTVSLLYASPCELSSYPLWCRNTRTLGTCAAFHQSVFSCVCLGCLPLLLHIHIGCNDTVFPRCASCCAFWGRKPYCMKSCTVCICVVSPWCEWGSVSSIQFSEWMTCCTLGNHISWSQGGSARDASSNIHLCWMKC